MGIGLVKNKIVEAKPFLKWAGGKGQLLSTFRLYYPQQLLAGNINKYFEPFVGGGAVLFDILQNFNVNEAVIADINKDLINTYKVVRDNVEQLVEVLECMEKSYISLGTEERKLEYYSVRTNFNEKRIAIEGNDIEKAAKFIFLNRTCFNGLYRVNRSGGFNVPTGDYTNPTICDNDNLYAASELLKRVNIICSDFKNVTQNIDDKTFVYFDPPYRPLNITSNFTSYSEQAFNDDDQKELASLYSELNSIGALLMLSNSDPKNTNADDCFFDDLYNNFNIRRVQAKRAINSKGGSRGSISEILVTNYES